MSASGVASARIGAIARSPASTSPAKTIRAITMGLPCSSAGTNGSGGALMTFAIIESSSSAASAAATSPVITSALAGSIACRRRPRRCHGAGTAAGSRPRSCRRRPEAPRRDRRGSPRRPAGARRPRYHLGAEEVVDREPVLAHQEADAAAEGDPADADGGRVAEPGGEAVFAGRLRVVAGLAGLRPGGAVRRRRSRPRSSRRGRGRSRSSEVP